LRRLDVLGLRVLKAVIRVRAIVARVATRVREERVRKHLTFDDLALTASVARSSLIRFETGKSGIQLETLARLVVRGLELDWSVFMATTGPVRRTRAGARVPAPMLSEQDMERVRRRMRAILVILGDAAGPSSAPDSV
jgi:transcriptional regulator with XRE-family HTH domain